MGTASGCRSWSNNRTRQGLPGPVKVRDRYAGLAAAVAAASTAAAITSTAAAAAAFTTLGAIAGRTGLSGADVERPTFAGAAVEGLDGCLAFRIGRHGDESEAAAAARIAVHDDLGTRHGAVGGEELGQTVVIDRPRQITDIEFHRYLESGADAPGMAPQRCRDG